MARGGATADTPVHPAAGRRVFDEVGGAADPLRGLLLDRKEAIAAVRHVVSAGDGLPQSLRPRSQLPLAFLESPFWVAKWRIPRQFAAADRASAHPLGQLLRRWQASNSGELAPRIQELLTATVPCRRLGKDQVTGVVLHAGTDGWRIDEGVFAVPIGRLWTPS